MEKSILIAEGLCKSFSNNGIVNPVLNDISLAIKDGDFTVIMGSSGSGKSTLLYTLSGMDKVTSGNVYYKDMDISHLKAKEIARLHSKEFGFIFQQMHLIPSLTIFENIVIHGYLNKDINSKAVNEKGRLLAAEMEIGDILDRFPSQVSGGEQQRAAIARALISEPALIFADEPTGALNKQTGTEVLDLLTEVNNKGQSVLMVTHDLRASIRANRILYLEDGEIRGEITLPLYTSAESAIREKQVTLWLSGRGW